MTPVVVATAVAVTVFISSGTVVEFMYTVPQDIEVGASSSPLPHSSFGCDLLFVPDKAGRKLAAKQVVLSSCLGGEIATRRNLATTRVSTRRARPIVLNTIGRRNGAGK